MKLILASEERWQSPVLWESVSEYLYSHLVLWFSQHHWKLWSLWEFSRQSNSVFTFGLAKESTNYVLCNVLTSVLLIQMTQLNQKYLWIPPTFPPYSWTHPLLVQFLVQVHGSYINWGQKVLVVHQHRIHWMPIMTQLWMNLNWVTIWFHLGDLVWMKLVLCTYIGRKIGNC